MFTVDVPIIMLHKAALLLPPQKSIRGCALSTIHYGIASVPQTLSKDQEEDTLL